jgi:hypothetical protein
MALAHTEQFDNHIAIRVLLALPYGKWSVLFAGWLGVYPVVWNRDTIGRTICHGTGWDLQVILRVEKKSGDQGQQKYLKKLHEFRADFSLSHLLANCNFLPPQILTSDFFRVPLFHPQIIRRKIKRSPGLR